MNSNEIKPDNNNSATNIPLASKNIKKKIIYRRASKITPEPTEWLWPNVFAFGKYALLAGEGGLGKSQLAIFIAAALSTQKQWPHSQSVAKKGRTIILSAEDDASTTIVPRLIAADANLEFIEIIDAVQTQNSRTSNMERQFDLTKDIDALEKMLSELNDVLLIIIDPISSYLGTINTYNNCEVRGTLAPLAKLAEKYNVAIVCITHLNKSNDVSAKSRVTGSIAFLNAARSGFLVIEDPNDSDVRLFIELKNNLAHCKLGYKFTIEEYKIEGTSVTTSRIKWLDETTEITATQALKSLLPELKTPSAQKEAISFLKTLLSKGPVESTSIYLQADEIGISKATLRRAKEKLEVQVKRNISTDNKAYWCWALPNENYAQDKPDQH